VKLLVTPAPGAKRTQPACRERLAEFVFLALVGLLGLDIRSPPTHAPQQEATPRLEPVTGRFWIWSGEQLLDLTSLEEAQWYGRFAAR
jgi:hypothetical protein